MTPQPVTRAVLRIKPEVLKKLQEAIERERLAKEAHQQNATVRKKDEPG